MAHNWGKNPAYREGILKLSPVMRDVNARFDAQNSRLVAKMRLDRSGAQTNRDGTVLRPNVKIHEFRLRFSESVFLSEVNALDRLDLSEAISAMKSSILLCNCLISSRSCC